MTNLYWHHKHYSHIINLACNSDDDKCDKTENLECVPTYKAIGSCACTADLTWNPTDSVCEEKAPSHGERKLDYKFYDYPLCPQPFMYFIDVQDLLQAGKYLFDNYY